ncbi:MAG: hypothetical protein JWM80_5170 [Cyanobacteria bacterium RYN_339]|nr:hypothetical protein [Cyanobacteria bacterium RYN_339]
MLAISACGNGIVIRDDDPISTAPIVYPSFQPLETCQPSISSDVWVAATSGVYRNTAIPAAWKPIAADEAKITEQISNLADQQREAWSTFKHTPAWTTFKCYFPDTAKAWRQKTGRTD